MADGAADFAWGEQVAGLQAGLLRLPDRAPSGQSVRLIGAVRNAGHAPAIAPAICELRVHTATGTASLTDGPRATAALVIGAGTHVEVLGWRIAPDVTAPERTCSVEMWCLLDVRDWIRSGAVRIDFDG